MATHSRPCWPAPFSTPKRLTGWGRFSNISPPPRTASWWVAFPAPGTSVVPGTSRSRQRSRDRQHETYFPAQQPEAQTHTRFPEPHGNPCRPGSAETSSRTRSQASLGLTLDSELASGSFPRSARLLNRAAFDHVFKRRTTTARVSGLLCLIAESASTEARIGFAISKKHIPHAVDRNRLKRLLRNRFRVLRGELPPVDLVLLSQREISGINREEWPELCSQLFVRIIARSGSQA